MLPLARGEVEQSARAPELLSRLVDGPDPEPGILPGAPTLVDYLTWALEGGFPGSVGLGPLARSAWYEGFVEQLVQYDAAEIAAVRNAAGMSRLLRAVAHNTAVMPVLATLAEAAALDRRTATSSHGPSRTRRQPETRGGPRAGDHLG